MPFSPSLGFRRMMPRRSPSGVSELKGVGFRSMVET
jgi:hypothetical protein